MEGAVVVGKLLERNAEADYGYNAATNTYQDLVKAGIIDPLKVHPSSCVALLKQCDWTCTIRLLCRALQTSVLYPALFTLIKIEPKWAIELQLRASEALFPKAVCVIKSMVWLRRAEWLCRLCERRFQMQPVSAAF